MLDSARAGAPRSLGRLDRRVRGVELRDGGERWAGKGVGKAVANVNGEIAEALRGAGAAEQGRRSTAP